jgi:outer membrane protein insertion porin family/translocation and assembly module TamA
MAPRLLCRPAVTPRVTPRAWSAVAAALLFAIAPASPATAQERGDDQSRPEVKDLSLRGVRAVDEELLRASISTDESHCRSLLLRVAACWWTKRDAVYERAYLDRTELARDVLRIRVFYWQRGYREAKVDTSVVAEGPGRVNVAFRITEGEPTRITAIRAQPIPRILRRRDLRRLILVRRGDPLDLVRIDSSVARLRDALWERGYADAEVDTLLGVNAAQHEARVAFAIDPKYVTRVGTITVAGNEHVSERTIRNSLTFDEGDVFRRSEAVESQRNLYESNLFRAAVIAPPEGDSLKSILVAVQEAPLREARASAGFSTAEFVQVEGRFTHYNLFNRASRLELRGVVGNLFAPALNDRDPFWNVLPEDFVGEARQFLRPTWQASVDLTQPWFRSARNTLSLSAFARRRSVPAVVIDRGVGGSAIFTRHVAFRAPLSLTYRYEVTRVDAGDVYFCVSFGTCDVATIDALRRNQALSPAILTGQIDRTNDPFSPTAGYIARADFEHASGLTASEFRYNRAYADGSVYRRFGRGTLAGRLRLGWVDPLASTAQALNATTAEGEDIPGLLHPRKRFYAGGSQSVRGFGENQLGPRILTVSPAALARIGCDTTSATALAACDPNATFVTADGASVRLGRGDFTPRALGGTTLLEANIEYRFPVWRQLGGAVFVDGAVVGEASLESAIEGTAAITPGFGIRYYSPVGPIRVDLGFNPGISEDLAVVTEVGRGANRQLVVLADDAFDPPRARPRTYRDVGKTFLDHLTLHLSIGQAF